MDSKALEEARKAMIAKRFGGCATGASTGGEGTARRKKKRQHESWRYINFIIIIISD